MDEKLKVDIEESIWVNMLQQQIRVRKRAFPEIIHYINSMMLKMITMNMVLKQ